jgi:hypothetical protein
MAEVLARKLRGQSYTVFVMAVVVVAAVVMGEPAVTGNDVKHDLASFKIKPEFELS